MRRRARKTHGRLQILLLSILLYAVFFGAYELAWYALGLPDTEIVIVPTMLSALSVYGMYRWVWREWF